MVPCLQFTVIMMVILISQKAGIYFIIKLRDFLIHFGDGMENSENKEENRRHNEGKI